MTQDAILPASASEPAAQDLNPVLGHLLTRRSVSAGKLHEPGPNAKQLEIILRCAARVPDHKKLAPWRFIVFAGEARVRIGETLANICRANEPEASPDRLNIERERFSRSPVVVGVVWSPRPHPGAPDWEQMLSTGAVCMNLIHGACALGFSCHWLSEWYTYDRAVADVLGLAPDEKLAGFIHIGTPLAPPEERERPDIQQITTYF
jgi:nitroreductase